MGPKLKNLELKLYQETNENDLLNDKIMDL